MEKVQQLKLNALTKQIKYSISECESELSKIPWYTINKEKRAERKNLKKLILTAKNDLKRFGENGK